MFSFLGGILALFITGAIVFEPLVARVREKKLRTRLDELETQALEDRRARLELEELANRLRSRLDTLTDSGGGRSGAVAAEVEEAVAASPHRAEDTNERQPIAPSELTSSAPAPTVLATRIAPREPDASAAESQAMYGARAHTGAHTMAAAEAAPREVTERTNLPVAESGVASRAEGLQITHAMEEAAPKPFTQQPQREVDTADLKPPGAPSSAAEATPKPAAQFERGTLPAALEMSMPGPVVSEAGVEPTAPAHGADETPAIHYPRVPSTTPKVPTAASRALAWLRSKSESDEWEAVVGASWLNKIGVFVLVVGIALFLGYAFTYLPAWGRVAIGYLVSGVILATGVWLERKARYLLFARGLIAGGWAAIYFTSYATYNVDASRVISSPGVAMGLLIAVAAGMIVHSLRYRAEVITGLAYLSAFGAMLLAPSSGFAAVASLPLIVSLVFVAQREGWIRLIIGGLIGTYGLYSLNRPDVLTGHPATAMQDQLVLAVYWIVFEAADLLALRRRSGPTTSRLGRAIFPLNVTAFVGMSLLVCQWHMREQLALALFLLACAVAFLADTLLRARLCPSRSFQEGARLIKRMIEGSYEAALTIAVLLGTVGLLLAWSDDSRLLALAVEGECLLLAGMRLRERYPRQLGAAVLVLPWILALALLLPPLMSDAHAAQPGEAVIAVSAARLRLIALFALMLYGNRWLSRRQEDGASIERIGAAGATALAALCVLHATSPAFQGLALLSLALPLFWAGLHPDLPELRRHGYVVGAVGYIVLAARHAHPVSGAPLALRTALVTLSAAIAVSYGMARVSRHLSDAALPPPEKRALWFVSSAAGSLGAIALLFDLLSPTFRGLGWWLLGSAMFEYGRRNNLPTIRVHGYLSAMLAAVAWTVWNLLPDTVGEGSPPWRLLGLASALAYVGTAYLRGAGGADLPHSERTRTSVLVSLTGTVALACFLARAVPQSALAIGWLVLAWGLFETGVARDFGALRAQGYVLAGAAFALGFLTNALQYLPVVRSSAADLPWWATPWLPLGVLAAIYYGLTLRIHRCRAPTITAETIARVRACGSVAGTLLSGALAWHVLELAYVALAWSALATLLLECGLRANSRAFRLQAYVSAFGAVSAIIAVYVVDFGSRTTPITWHPLAVLAPLAYSWFIRAHRSPTTDVGGPERSVLLNLSATAGALLVAFLAWFALPSVLVAIAWAMLALVLYEIGAIRDIHLLRRHGMVVLGATCIRIVIANLAIPDGDGLVSTRITTTLPVIVELYYFWHRMAEMSDAGRGLPGDAWKRRACLYAAAALAFALVRFEAGRVLAVAGWAALTVALLHAGIRLSSRDLRWQAYVIAGITVVRCWVTNIYAPEYLLGWFNGRVAGGVVTAALLLCQLLSPRRSEVLPERPGTLLGRLVNVWDTQPRVVFSLLSSAVLAVLLFHEVSGQMLTISWALQGAALVGGGFLLKERVMRVSGLLLFAGCVLKLFGYDFQQLETIFRILSFILLGILLIAMSLIYTRYRERLRELL